MIAYGRRPKRNQRESAYVSRKRTWRTLPEPSSKKMNGQIFPDDIQGYLQDKWVGDLYCLPVLWDNHVTYDFPLSGLLLRRGGRLGDFVRFGYFSVSDDVDSLKLAYDCFHESSESQDLRLIGSLQRDGDYVITLI